MGKLHDEWVKAYEEIEYPKGFPIKEFNKKIEELIKETPQGVREKDLTDFLSDILFKQDISLDEFTVKLSYWTNSELIDEIIAIKYIGRLFVPFYDIRGKIYPHIQNKVGSF